MLKVNTRDWLSFIEHQFVNGACPLFTEFFNFVAKFFRCSLSAPSPLPLHPFFDRCSIDVR